MAPPRGPHDAAVGGRQPPRLAATADAAGATANVGVWATGVEGPAGDKEAAGAIASTGTPTTGGTGLVVIAVTVVCVARGSGALALAVNTVGTVVALAGRNVAIEAGGGAGATAGVSVAKGRGRVATAAGNGAVAEARDGVCVVGDATAGVHNARGDPAATMGSAAGEANTGVEVGVATSGSVTTCAGAFSGAGAADGKTVESSVVPPTAQVTGRGEAAFREGRRRKGGKPAAARSRAAFSDFSARCAAAARLFSKEAAAVAFVLAAFLAFAAWT